MYLRSPSGPRPTSIALPTNTFAENANSVCNGGGEKSVVSPAVAIPAQHAATHRPETILIIDIANLPVHKADARQARFLEYRSCGFLVCLSGTHGLRSRRNARSCSIYLYLQGHRCRDDQRQ